MINLDTTTKSLEVLLGGAVAGTQLPFSASYVDTNVSPVPVSEANGTTNNTSAVTLVSAPASSKRRIVKSLGIYNADSAEAAVTVRVNDNGTFRILVKTTLAVGSTLMLTEGEQWKVLKANGEIAVGSAAANTNALLDGVNHTDTLAGTVVRGDIVVGNSTPKWARKAIGASGTVLTSDGTDVNWTASAMRAYAATVADVSNSTTKTAIISFTVGANEMANGDILFIEIPALWKQNTGVARVATWEFAWGATVVNPDVAETWSNSATERLHTLIVKCQRVGSDLWIRKVVFPLSNAATNLPEFGLWSADFPVTVTSQASITPTFTSSQVVEVRMTFNAADTTFYIKPQSYNVYKIARG